MKSFKYLFLGKLEPKNIIKDFNLQVIGSFKSLDFDVEGDVDMRIKKNNLHLYYSSNIDHTTSTANLETLRNFIQDYIDSYINVYGYIHSLYLDAYLIKVKCKKLDLNYQFVTKGEFNLINKPQNNAQKEFDKIIKAQSKEEKLNLIRYVLWDFKHAIKYPAQTGQFCFRAIEGIRVNYYENLNIVDNDARRDESWGNLRKQLGYERNDFYFIEKYAIPNRHGAYPAITYSEREKIMNFTRELIDKFISLHQ
jgi:hypothetical protein